MSPPVSKYFSYIFVLPFSTSSFPSACNSPQGSFRSLRYSFSSIGYLNFGPIKLFQGRCVAWIVKVEKKVLQLLSNIYKLDNVEYVNISRFFGIKIEIRHLLHLIVIGMKYYVLTALCRWRSASWFWCS